MTPDLEEGAAATAWEAGGVKVKAGAAAAAREAGGVKGEGDTGKELEATVADIFEGCVEFLDVWFVEVVFKFFSKVYHPEFNQMDQNH